MSGLGISWLKEGMDKSCPNAGSESFFFHLNSRQPAGFLFSASAKAVQLEVVKIA
ncbi:MAG: hypothetical protein HY394_03855 [Candidatus Diapherotrites archaeon]|nr:hypothetical protein [Candidatus Diapherotrites archaeon]